MSKSVLSNRDVATGALDQLLNVILCEDGLPVDCQWFSYDPVARRPLRDNFSDDQSFARPAEDEIGLHKIRVNLWATVSENGDVLGQTAEHFRRMADLLLKSADAVDQERLSRT